MAQAESAQLETTPREPTLPWLRVVSAPIVASLALWAAYALSVHACAWATTPWQIVVFGAAAASCGGCLAGLHVRWRKLPVDARAERFAHAVAIAVAWFSLLVVVGFVIAFAMVKRCD